jgi:hypothetical protein
MEQESRINIQEISPIAIPLINGPKGGGKDTVGAIIKLLLGNYASQFVFANALKEKSEVDYSYYGLTKKHFFDDRFKELPLLKLPVVASDVDCEARQRRIAEHFRTADGRPPSKYIAVKADDRFYTFFLANGANDAGELLYWTPRAILIEQGCSKRSVVPDYWPDRCNDLITACATANPEVIQYGTDLRFRNEKAGIQRAFPSAKVYMIKILCPTKHVANDSTEADLRGTVFDFTIDNSQRVERGEDQELPPLTDPKWEFLRMQVASMLEKICQDCKLDNVLSRLTSQSWRTCE